MSSWCWIVQSLSSFLFYLILFTSFCCSSCPPYLRWAHVHTLWSHLYPHCFSFSSVNCFLTHSSRMRQKSTHWPPVEEIDLMCDTDMRCWTVGVVSASVLLVSEHFIFQVSEGAIYISPSLCWVFAYFQTDCLCRTVFSYCPEKIQTKSYVIISQCVNWWTDWRGQENWSDVLHFFSVISSFLINLKQWCSYCVIHLVLRIWSFRLPKSRQNAMSEIWNIF